LLQPDFRGAWKRVSFRKAEIRPIFDDGTSASITNEQFLSELPGSHRAVVMERIFRKGEKPVRGFVSVKRLFPGLPLPQPRPASESDREIQRWIGARMDRLFPGRRVRKVRFSWRTVACDLTARPPVPKVVAESLFEVTLANN
jgi:hypothetical protein